MKKTGWNEKSDHLSLLRLAFTEAIVNAMGYGNLGIVKTRDGEQNLGILIKDELKKLARNDPERKKNRKVHVTVQVNKERLTVKVCDEGRGFNWREIPEPDDSDETDLKTTGRGISYMKCFDSVTYSNKGNEVTLVKERGHKIVV